MPERKLAFGIYKYGQDDREVSEPDQPFADIQSYIVNLYQVFLPKVKTLKKIKKINIELVAEADGFCINPENADSDVVTIKETFDFERFNDLDLNGKKELLFKFTYDCIAIVFEKLELGHRLLKSTYDFIINKDSELFVDIGGSPKLNKKKDTIGKVIAEFFISYVLISVVFTNDEGEDLRKINLFKTFSHHIFYSHLIKTSKWLDNNVFQLSNKTKEINIQVNTDGIVSITYAPLDRDIDGIKEEIRYYNKELFFEL